MNTILALGLIGAFVGFVFSYIKIRDIYRIHRTPTGYISTLPLEGQVEVVGKADGKAIDSKLTQKTCVYWKVLVEERRSSGKSSYWATLYNQTSTEPFEVSDGTGTVQIVPANAKLILRDDISASSGDFPYPTPEISTALDKLNIDTTGFLELNRTIRVYERCIKSGDQIYILGEIKYEKGTRMIASKKGRPLIISGRSERELLQKLYWPVVGNIAFSIIVVIEFGRLYLLHQK